MISCGLCLKHILSHSLSLRCSVCFDFVHLNCIPHVNRDDLLYTQRLSNNWICVNCNKNLFPFNHLDEDTEFLNVLSEGLSKNSQISIELLNSKIFNPFSLNEDLYLSDVDPDLQYLNSVVDTFKHGSSDYYLEDDFNRKCKRLSIKPNSFSVIHLNIRSISRNLNAFETYLKNLAHKFTVLGLTETWLNNSNFKSFCLAG